MEFGTPNFPETKEIKKDFINPYLKEGEVLLGNFEETDEDGNFKEGQEEDDRVKFSDIEYTTKRRILAYDINGKELPGMFGVAVSKEEYDNINEKNNE